MRVGMGAGTGVGNPGTLRTTSRVFEVKTPGPRAVCTIACSSGVFMAIAPTRAATPTVAIEIDAISLRDKPLPPPLVRCSEILDARAILPSTQLRVG